MYKYGDLHKKLIYMQIMYQGSPPQRQGNFHKVRAPPHEPGQPSQCQGKYPRITAATTESEQLVSIEPPWQRQVPLLISSLHIK